MKIIGQPESYSEILQRIFFFSVATGICCSIILAKASPAFKAFMDSIPNEAEIPFIKGLKASYVLIPLVISFISIRLRLHDKISDLLCIRFLFDTKHILYPLAELSGHDLTSEIKSAINKKRESAMYAVFYPYAGFADPKIDKQLVRTALDNWGWFWVDVETILLCVLTMIILICLGNCLYIKLFAVILFVLLIFILYQWFACKSSAKRQVTAILDDPLRKSAIYNYFVKYENTQKDKT